MPLQEELLAADLVLALAPWELTEASLRKRNGGWIGMIDMICSIGRNFVGFGSGRPRTLHSMNCLTSPSVRKWRNSSLLIDICSTSSTRMTISIIVSESMPRSSIKRRSSSGSLSLARRSGSTYRSMMPSTMAGRCSVFLVLRNWKAAS
jgi:hypothetical protein